MQGLLVVPWRNTALELWLSSLEGKSDAMGGWSTEVPGGRGFGRMQV
jgi:hypothetical protein